ncbi:DUF3068 domain-containing protein [Nocardioides jensenii]|uniref:DUF3068 domain-containing protein n=1 Tax=Nocardioides jensenii TaxID=1843 RepID=UPI000AC38368|nr:DUF3068 domain-containing protein [Nocardioides jensenii]
MRKTIHLVLLGLGAFLLVAAIVATIWAPGQVKRTPLDTDSTTHLAGQGEKLNPATGNVEPIQVRATSYTKADSKKSDDDVIVFVSTTCLVLDKPDTPDCGVEGTGEDADPNVVNISTDVFATDRKTGEAVNDSKYLPDDAEKHDGVVNKFPFDTEKKSYQYWDGMLGRAVEAKYSGSEKVDGVETYKFDVDIVDEPAEVVTDVEGIYSMDKSMWIEPRTGAIIKQEQHEVRTLENGDVLLDLEVAFTDDQVKSNASDADDNISSLNLLTKTVPLIGYILGPLLMLIGAALLILSRRGVGTRKG